MDRIRNALLTGPKSVEELLQLKIPRATTYRDLKRMLNAGEVTQTEGRDGEGKARTLYALTEVTLPASHDLIHEVLTRVNSDDAKVRYNALEDLRTICKEYRIVEPAQLNTLLSQAEANSSLTLFEILNHQAVYARKYDDHATIKLLQPLIPKAESIVENTKTLPDERYEALRFLQLTADFQALSELALKIISKPRDPALNPSKPTQLAITLQSICVRASRLAKYRGRIYDLLLSSNPSIANMANQILHLSRQPQL